MKFGLSNFFKAKPEEPPVDLQNRYKILVVDDDQLLRTFYHDLLTKHNYDVITATNGQEALGIIPQQRPHLVLLDIVMPVMDGKTTLKLIRENKDLATIPVVMLTSAASIQNMEETTSYEANGFMNKNTVTPEEIVSTVQEALIPKAKLLNGMEVGM